MTVSEALEAADFLVWSDLNLLAAEPWREAIQKQIAECSLFVVIVSQRWKYSEYTQDELNLALSLPSPPAILPILIDDTEPKLIQLISEFAALPFRDEQDLKRIVDQALVLVGQSSHQPSA